VVEVEVRRDHVRDVGELVPERLDLLVDGVVG
jgi:hypothetical protein